MKKLLSLSILLFGGFLVNAQIFDKIINSAKNSAERKAENTSGEIVDKSLNKIEEGIGNVFKKKEKNTTNQPITTPKNTKDYNDNTDYTAYKKFDFIPSKDIIFFDNFADQSSKRWLANEQTSVTNIPNNKENWLEIKSGRFHPIGQKTLPKNFTLEFDVATNPNLPCGTLEIEFIDQSQSSRLTDPYLDNSSHIILSPISQIPKTGLSNYNYKIDNNSISPQNETPFFSWLPQSNKTNARISISRNGNRITAYVNEEKILDNVDFFSGTHNYMLTFHLQNYFVEETRMYFTNFRLATGTNNVKTEITNNGKFITNTIYFDINSSRIKPESWATLKQIAETIKAIPGNIMIVGHTDSDGNDVANLTLSQKRVISIKNALVKEFGIIESKISTEGKGETQPLNANKTELEKAQNRRVEFIKL